MSLHTHTQARTHAHKNANPRSTTPKTLTRASTHSHMHVHVCAWVQEFVRHNTFTPRIHTQTAAPTHKPTAETKKHTNAEAGKPEFLSSPPTHSRTHASTQPHLPTLTHALACMHSRTKPARAHINFHRKCDRKDREDNVNDAVIKYLRHPSPSETQAGRQLRITRWRCMALWHWQS
jgi:hypothetical protein